MQIGSKNPQGNFNADAWVKVYDQTITDGGFNSQTQMLLHFDGTDGATSTTDEMGATVTFGGTAQLDTAQYKFGTASLLLDGNSDYISLPDNANYELGANDWTIDCWIRINNLPGNDEYDYVFSKYQLTGNKRSYALALWNNGGTYKWVFYYSTDGTAGTLGSVIVTTSISANTWYHIAVVRYKNRLEIFQNGTSYGSYGGLISTTFYNNDIAFLIGAILPDSPTGFFDGWIDEFRLINGTAMYTSNFTPALQSTTDSYTKLLLNLDGADGATTYTAETGQTVTFAGTAQLDTAQYKYGTSSVLLDGNSDYLSLPDSSDWTLASNDFTLECWVRFNDVSSSQAIIANVKDSDPEGNLYWILFYYTSPGRISFDQNSNGASSITVRCEYTFSTGIWYHVAVTRVGANFQIFVNGVGQTLTHHTGTSNNIVANNDLLKFGVSNGSYYFNGWIDNIRISNGVSRYMSGFTPPTSAYSGKVTSLTISGLDGNTAKKFMFRARIVGSSATGNTYKIALNGDTTSGNYGYQRFTNYDTTIAASRSTFGGIYIGYISVANTEGHFRVIIDAKSGYQRMAIIESLRLDTATTIGIHEFNAHTWTNTADNITSMVLSCDKAGGIGIGSQITLWQLQYAT